MGSKKSASAKPKATKTSKTKVVKAAKAEPIKKVGRPKVGEKAVKAKKSPVKTVKTVKVGEAEIKKAGKVGISKAVKAKKSTTKTVKTPKTGKVGRPKAGEKTVKAKKSTAKTVKTKKAGTTEVKKIRKISKAKSGKVKITKTSKKTKATGKKVSRKTEKSKGMVGGREVPREEITREVPQKITPEMMEDHPEKKWYVIHTYSGYEHKVRNNLLKRADTLGMIDRIFNVIVPTEEEIEFKDGKKRTVQRKIFPGYVLVQMIMTEDSWFVVRNTAGVTSFVGPKVKPLPLPHSEVKEIFRRMGMEAPSKVQIDLEKGQGVRIIRGPFKDFSGLVEEVSPEKEKVKILITIFGRETPVELEFSQIEKL